MYRKGQLATLAFIIAIPAINWTVAPWLERHLSLHPAVSTDGMVHPSAASRFCVARVASCRTAGRAPGGFVAKTPLVEELLFSGTEHELCPAIPTSQGLVSEFHPFDLLLLF
jgi:hypothetical protein